MTDTYTFLAGEEAASRLMLLNQIFNPNSLNLIKRYIRPDSRVLTIGCGIGVLDCEVADCLSEGGHLTGIDSNEEQVFLARQRALELGYTNTSFAPLSAKDVDQLDEKFDCIVCRFVLCHLGAPEQILTMAQEKLKPGGVLICEDTTGTDSHVCSPPNPAYEAWRRYCRLQAEVHGTDFEIGLKLPRYLKRCGLDIVHTSFFQPVLNGPKERYLLRMNVEHVSPVLIEAGFCTEEESLRLAEELKLLEMDDSALVAYIRTAQVVGKKIQRYTERG